MTPENQAKIEYLDSYNEYVRELERARLRIEELRSNKQNPSYHLSFDVGGNKITDLSNYAALLDAEERRYVMIKHKCNKRCVEIQNQIEKLEKTSQKDLLTYKYIKRMKWHEICNVMDRSWTQIHRIHSEALKNFEIPKKKKNKK